VTGLLDSCIADLSLQEIAAALGGEVSNLQVTAPGPNHSPKDRSLSVKLDANAPGGFIVHSFAGDDPIVCRDFVREKCGLEPFKSNGKANEQAVVVASYHYFDENGETLFVVDQYDPKGFRQRRPDGKGGWQFSLGDVRRVPYRLPEVIEAVACETPICIAEGEKAVEALEQIGITATCSPGGAGKWRKEYSDHLKGANVVILPDADDPGEQHAISVAGSLGGVAKKVQVLRLPNLPDKGDPFDWIAKGGTADAFWKLVEATPEYAGSDAKHDAPKGRSLVMRCAADIEPEPIKWVWPGRIAKGKHTAIAGEPGIAKSQLALDFVATLTKGGLWPHGEGQAPCGRVILLSAEDGAADTIVPRLMAAKADLSRVQIIHAVQNEGGKGHHTFNLQTDLDLLGAEIR
jgi:putative DNA primase/helicase